MAKGDEEIVLFLNEQPSLRNKSRWMPCLIGIMCVTSLTSAVICIGMCTVSLRAVSDLKGITTQQGRDVEAYHSAQEVAAIQWQYPSIVRSGELHRSKRRAGGRRTCRERRRRRRHSSHHRHHSHRVPPYVHLVGTTTNNSDAVFYGGNFVWSIPNVNESGSGVEVISSPDPHQIRINESGIYEVYSQIGIKGRINGASATSHVSCGHKTVLRRNSQDTDLMESRVTQHNLGDEYIRGPVRGFAFDTIIHKGTFRLLRDDTLRVRTVANCLHFRFKSSPTFAYFGVVQIYSFNYN